MAAASTRSTRGNRRHDERACRPRHRATPAADSQHRRASWRLLGPDGREHDFQHRPCYTADDLLTLKYAVLQGTGMCVLPDYMCGQELQQGLLEQVLPDWAPRTGVMHAVFPSRRGMVPAVRRFLDFLGEQVTSEGLSPSLLPHGPTSTL